VAFDDAQVFHGEIHTEFFKMSPARDVHIQGDVGSVKCKRIIVDAFGGALPEISCFLIAMRHSGS
jgi:hypothetical protein